MSTVSISIPTMRGDLPRDGINSRAQDTDENLISTDQV